MAERVKVMIEVEKKVLATCEGDLGVLSGAVVELQERVKEVGGEVDSRVAAAEGRCEEKIGVLERAVE